jgi:hypothetical protein
MKFFLLLLASSLFAQDNARIVYTKEFKGAVPAYVKITVEKNGDAQYQEAPADDNPMKFKLNEEERTAIFGYAEKLEHFRRPLESGLKVAFMGTKTFRFESGAEKAEIKFNYSQDEDAQQLWNWFERISQTELQFIRLERVIRFDKLGVNQELLQLQILVERKQLIAPEQFLPLLDRIVKNDTFMHMSRERAAALAELFRAKKAA